jgi:HNH/ENDO VII superfamily nuclease
MADGMFDDLVPAKKAEATGGMFDDLVAGAKPRATIPNAPLGEPDHVTMLDPVVVRPEPEAPTLGGRAMSALAALGTLPTRAAGFMQDTVVPGVTGAFERSDLGGAVKRGTTSMLASGLHSGADLIDQTLQAPQRQLVELLKPTIHDRRTGAVNKQATDELRAAWADPLGAQALANESLGVEREIGADRTTAQEAIGPMPTLGEALANPQEAIARKGASLLTTGVESAPGMALAIATRNPELGSSILAGTTGAQEYTDLRGQGVGRDKAIPAALLTAMSEKAGEQFGLEKILAPGRIASVLPAIVGEGGQEFGVQLAQGNVEDQALGRETPIMEQIKQAADAGLIGAGMGGGAHGLSVGIDALGSREAAPFPNAAPRQQAPAAPVEAPQTNAIAPEVLAAGNAALGAAPAEAAPAPVAAAAPAPLGQAEDSDDLGALLAANIPPEVAAQAQQVAANASPEQQQSAMEVLGRLLNPTPAAPSDSASPAATPAPPPADGAAATSFMQQAAASMRMRSQEQAAQTPAPAVQSPAMPDGYRSAGGDLTPAPTPAKPARKPAIKTDSARKPMDLLRVLATNGGLNREAFRAEGVDPAELSRRAGFHYLFRKKGGMSKADMREFMQQEGYLPRDPEDGQAVVDDNDAYDVFDRAFRSGESIYSDDQADAVATMHATKKQADEEFEAELAGDPDWSTLSEEDFGTHQRAEISDLTERAYDLGATDEQIVGAAFDASNDELHRNALQRIVAQLEHSHAVESEAAGRPGESRAQPREEAEPASGFSLANHEPAAARQEVAPASADLFGAPTTRDFVDNAQRERDAARDGKTGTGRTDMAAGDGELFAGRRPEQARVPEPASNEQDDAEPAPAGSDLPEISRRMGEADAESLGLRAAVNEALGKVGEKVIFLRGYEGLPERSRAGIQQRTEQRGGQGRTAALYDPNTKNVYVFTQVVRTPDRAVWNAAHEIAGHEGLRTLLGDKLDHALGIALQNPTVQAVADAIAKERALRGDQRLLAAEESLAELAAAVRTGDFAHIADRYKVDVPEGIRAGLTRAIENFLKRLRAMIDDIFGRHQFTDEDVRALLENAWQAVNQPANGELAPDLDGFDATAPDERITSEPVRPGMKFEFDATRTATVIDVRLGGQVSLKIQGTRNGKPSLSIGEYATRDVKTWPRLGNATFRDAGLEAVEPVDLADATGRSIIEQGRLLTVIDAAKAAGLDLTALQAAHAKNSASAFVAALDDLLAKLHPQRVTGTKNAVTDAERAAAGRNPILRDAIQTNQETLTRAMRELRDDPSAGRIAVERLVRGGVESVSLADEAIMLVHKTTLMNAREEAAKKLASESTSEEAKEVARREWAEAEAQIAQLDEAAVNSGREWGRMGQFRQRMLREDFTLAALERKERARLERPLTAEESSTIKAMAATIAELQTKVDALNDRVRNAESETAYSNVVDMMTGRGPKKRPTLESLRRAANDARARLKATPDVPSRRGQSGAVISPAVFADLSVIGAYHIADGAAKFADWISAMSADIGERFDAFKREHPNIFKASQQELDKPIRAEATVAEVMEGIDLQNVSPKDVRKLVSAYIGEGLRGEPAVVAAVAKALELEASDVRHLFVQTEPRAPQTLSEAQEELRDLRKIMRLQQEIERMEAGQPKPARGVPAEDSPAVAAKKQELADLRASLKPPRDPEARYQDMRTKQIEKRIADLQKRIADGDFAARPRVPRALSEANLRAQFELDKAKHDFLRHQFEDNLRKRSPLGKIFGTVGDAFNLARAVMTSLDLSAILRQGGFIGYGHPVRAASSIGPSLRAFVSERAEHRVTAEIESRPNAPLYTRYGLQLTGIGAGPLTQIEEAYASRWLERFPAWLGGGLVRGSGRSYTAFLNKLRADSFDAMAASLGRRQTLTEAEGKAIANYINVATGRGKIGRNENAGQVLNTIFFAPRLVASRFQLLAGQPMYGGTARSRNLIAREYARFMLGAGTAIALAAFGLSGDGDDPEEMIGLDPRSSNFLKIRVGNTYLDPMAGLAQVSTFIGRLATGETVTGSGSVKPLRPSYTLTDLRIALGADIPPHELDKEGGLKFGDGSAADVIGRFMRTKLAPVPGAIVNVLTGSDVIGQPMSPAETAQQLVTPMSFQSIGDIMEEQGIPKGTAITLLGLLGMGVQHRDDTESMADFTANIDLVKTDVKDRLADMPVEKWPAALEAMKKEYGPVMEGVDLDYYKTDGKYGAAGEPKRDENGKPKLKSSRLAVDDAYRANYVAGQEARGESADLDGKQIHHIIPDNLVRHHPLMAQARKLGYDLDHADNLIGMPDNGESADIGHKTSHPQYDEQVFTKLQAAQKALEKEYGDLPSAPKADVMDAVRKVEADMRKRIETRDVPVKNGRLADLEDDRIPLRA